MRNRRRFSQGPLPMRHIDAVRLGAIVALVLLECAGGVAGAQRRRTSSSRRAGGALRSTSGTPAQESRFAQVNSRSQYVHWIALYDVNKKKIDPADPSSPPYSPEVTCGKCHECDVMAQGYHFNATDENADPGRPGEPWVWTDKRTGTQIPLSYRGWAGAYRPDDLGISAWQFVLKFGRHMPGGGPGQGDVKDTDGEPDEVVEGRWRLAGRLEIDCMFCHSNDRSYSPSEWADQVAAENFAWAATAAMGLGQVRGFVKRLKDDFDPSAATTGEGTGPRLPQTIYRQDKFNGEKKVFFDIVRKPPNNACYHCHTVRPIGAGASPRWTQDEDVHVEAGLSCVDCHRNGVGHHTVRGFENETPPTSLPVAALSCRGCHMDGGVAGAQRQRTPGSRRAGGSLRSTPGIPVARVGGRFGAPKPSHKGLPPLHLEKMSCTSCHSGPMPREHAGLLQTSMAHQLGLPAHRDENLPPQMVSPVLLHNDEGILYPYRMMWPAFWGVLQNDKIAPLNPDEVYASLRRVLRVRRDFSKEIAKVRLSSEEKAEVLGDERAQVAETELSEEEKAKLEELIQTKAGEAFREKLAKALQKLAESDIDGTPVYVSGGKAYRLSGDDKVEAFEHPATKPYAWPLAHDVRPARHSLGATGCTECHSEGSPIFYGTVTAKGPAPDDSPVTTLMHESQGFDADLLAVWNQSFAGREPFKWVGFVSVGAVVLVLLLFLLLGLNGLFKFARGR